MLSGLPGAGKDTWIARNYTDWPVISLDALRQNMGISPSAPQGAVVDAAREMARGYLREGRDFVWNATNVSSQVRRKCLSLFFDYNAFVTIVYLERSRAVLFKQNRQREAVVPVSILEKLLRQWEVPALCEAHEVEYHAF
jgi:predicted kinase